MSTDRDTTRVVRSWLQTDEHESADRVLDGVLDQLDTTPQRRSTWWPARRFPEMSNTAKLALGGVAVVVTALLGIGFLLPGGPRIGGPGPTTPPTPTPSPISLDGANDRVLDAGTYVSTPFPADPMRFTLTFPAGWRAFVDGAFLPAAEGSSEAPDGMAFGFSKIDSLYSDPCFASGAGDVEVGTTVDELVGAFAEQTAYEVSAPTDVSLAGYSGKRVDLTLPSDLGTSTCGYEYFFPWPGSVYSQGPGNLWHLWILDVDGSRVVVTTNDFAGTPAEDRAEMQAILDSLRIEP
jgi:hypothetical protein